METNRLDPIENGLVELRDAERAKLFERTPLDLSIVRRTSVAPGGASTRLSWKLWWSAAAMIGLSVGVGSLMFLSELDRLRGNRRLLSERQTVAVARLAIEDFIQCFGGPTRGLGDRCRSHDFDADGDVDMADVGTYQLAYAVPTP